MLQGADAFLRLGPGRAVYHDALVLLLRATLVVPKPSHAPRDLVGECWEWQGQRLKDGYGQAWVTTPLGTRAKVYTHRYAIWLLTGRMLRDGELACHRCDNPPCMNVLEHLFVGTHSDNALDMSAKGRNVAQRPGQNAGERNTHARLTWAIVRQMRAEWAAGVFSTKAAGALAHGLHASTFGDIVERRTWWPEPEETP